MKQETTEDGQLLKTAAAWEIQLSIKVTDPAGWEDQEEDFFATPITLPRFRELCHDSQIKLVGNPDWG